MKNPRIRYAAHVAAFMIVCAVLLVGVTVLIGILTTELRLGPGVALFAVALWGFLFGGLAMAYWSDWLATTPAPAPAPTPRSASVDECPHLSVLDRRDGQQCPICDPWGMP